MTHDTDSWLAEAKPAETTVPLCLRGDIVAEFEELDRRLEEAQKKTSDSLAAGSQAAAIAQQIEALRERMQSATKTFRLRALPVRKYRELAAEHPPRRDPETGKPKDLDAFTGVNMETIFEPLIRKCLVDPQLNDEQWERLMEVLSDRQFDALADAAFGLNRRDVKVPFSRAASRILQNSDEESRRQNDSGSPSSASTGGSLAGSPPTSETTAGG